ncbi:MAG: hypothetical protein KKA19_03600, partial [Candidatus Margulisbacteria bacterium]|nr:hypothetical protein [Candidatus Margulisiibacteriota bacterium]
NEAFILEEAIKYYIEQGQFDKAHQLYNDYLYIKKVYLNIKLDEYKEWQRIVAKIMPLSVTDDTKVQTFLTSKSISLTDYPKWPNWFKHLLLGVITGKVQGAVFMDIAMFLKGYDKANSTSLENVYNQVIGKVPDSIYLRDIKTHAEDIDKNLKTYVGRRAIYQNTIEKLHKNTGSDYRDLNNYIIANKSVLDKIVNKYNSIKSTRHKINNEDDLRQLPLELILMVIDSIRNLRDNHRTLLTLIEAELYRRDLEILLSKLEQKVNIINSYVGMMITPATISQA